MVQPVIIRCHYFLLLLKQTRHVVQLKTTTPVATVVLSAESMLVLVLIKTRVGTRVGVCLPTFMLGMKGMKIDSCTSLVELLQK